MNELPIWSEVRGQDHTAGVVAERMVEPPADADVLRSCWARAFERGDLLLAEDDADRLLGQATRRGDLALTAVAQCAVGSVALLRGRILTAEAAFTQSLTARSQAAATPALQDGPDVISTCYRSWTRTLRGAVDQGLDQADHGVAAAQSKGEPITVLYAEAMRAAVRLWRGESDLFPEAVDQVADRRDGAQPLPWAALVQACRGWALARRGRGEDGLAALHSGLEAWRASGSGLLVPFFLALTMEAQLASGQIGAAMETGAAALKACDRDGENLMRGEVLRLRGLASARAGDRDGAVHCLVAAMTAASGSGAGLFELRAMMDLAEVLRDQGQCGLAAGGIARCLTQVESGSPAPTVAAARALFAELYGQAMG